MGVVVVVDVVIRPTYSYHGIIGFFLISRDHTVTISINRGRAVHWIIIRIHCSVFIEHGMSHFRLDVYFFFLFLWRKASSLKGCIFIEYKQCIFFVSVILQRKRVSDTLKRCT